MTTIRVGHLYPDYLNIYADRGNIAVLAARAAWRGHGLDVTELGLGDAIVPGDHDLYYLGGGQDREQLLVAENLAGKAEALRAAVLADGAALLLPFPPLSHTKSPPCCPQTSRDAMIRRPDRCDSTVRR